MGKTTLKHLLALHEKVNYQQKYSLETKSKNYQNKDYKDSLLTVPIYSTSIHTLVEENLLRFKVIIFSASFLPQFLLAQIQYHQY